MIDRENQCVCEREGLEKAIPYMWSVRWMEV